MALHKKNILFNYGRVDYDFFLNKLDENKEGEDKEMLKN